MALKEIYEKWSDDRRVLFVRWVLILFATGVGTLILGFYKDNSDANKFELLEKRVDSLSLTVTHYEIERIVMQNEIDKLRENQIKFNNLEDQFANPRILKSMNGDVFSINNAYYVDFMKPYGYLKSDYKNDLQFWGKKTADYIRSIEKIALDKERAVTIDADLENPFEKGTYIKRQVTINPLKDRYGNWIAFEISVNKVYK
tara:strand:+ start:44467 stop:45069 length:603 start_codon:yes stop_codon:yes gene_type:complete